MQVRRAHSADLETLVEFEKLFPSDRLSRASFRRWLQRGTADIWVLEKTQKMAANAVVLYRGGAKVARVYSLVVHPTHQRQGLAGMLMRCIEKSAYRRGCRELRLEVRPDNQAAIFFYQKIGYSIMKKMEGYYQDGTDALRMHKPLGSKSKIIKPAAAMRPREFDAAYPIA